MNTKMSCVVRSPRALALSGIINGKTLHTFWCRWATTHVWRGSNRISRPGPPAALRSDCKYARGSVLRQSAQENRDGRLPLPNLYRLILINIRRPWGLVDSVLQTCYTCCLPLQRESKKKFHSESRLQSPHESFRTVVLGLELTNHTSL